MLRDILLQAKLRYSKIIKISKKITTKVRIVLIGRKDMNAGNVLFLSHLVGIWMFDYEIRKNLFHLFFYYYRRDTGAEAWQMRMSRLYKSLGKSIPQRGCHQCNGPRKRQNFVQRTKSKILLKHTDQLPRMRFA